MANENEGKSAEELESELASKAADHLYDLMELCGFELQQGQQFLCELQLAIQRVLANPEKCGDEDTEGGSPAMNMVGFELVQTVKPRAKPL